MIVKNIWTSNREALMVTDKTIIHSIGLRFYKS